MPPRCAAGCASSGARSSAQPLPLSQRAARDALAARFAAWFGDLELPALLRALDPRLRDVPALVCGEPGTGRGSLARYLHAFGGGADGVFAQVACAPGLSASQLASAISAAARGARAGWGATLCLLGVDRLEPAVQRELVDWIELGPPAGLLRARPLRWIGTADDDAGRSAPSTPPCVKRSRACCCASRLSESGWRASPAW